MKDLINGEELLKVDGILDSISGIKKSARRRILAYQEVMKGVRKR